MKYNLENLIKEYEPIYYQNPDFNSKNFSLPKKVATKNWRLIKMENSFSSQEALDRIKKEGCRPANIYELLLWSKDNQEKGQWVLAFGSELSDADRDRRVPFVSRYSGGDWWFFLGVFEGVWFDAYCLLAFAENTQIFF